MPRKTPGVTVNPAVLKWARETAGYSPEDAARRFHIPAERIAAWETSPGPAHLTIRQLEELAHFCKRPTAALLLMDPPHNHRHPRTSAVLSTATLLSPRSFGWRSEEFTAYNA